MTPADQASFTNRWKPSARCLPDSPPRPFVPSDPVKGESTALPASVLWFS